MALQTSSSLLKLALILFANVGMISYPREDEYNAIYGGEKKHLLLVKKNN